MDIFTIRDNLVNTIKGKEQALATYKKALSKYDGSGLTGHAEMAVHASISFLDINIDELKKILADVEIVANKTTADIYRNG